AIDLTIAHPRGDTPAATAAAILAGPALYLAGNALFNFSLSGRIPRSRLVAIGALVLLVALAPAVDPLVLSTAATLVTVMLALVAGTPRRPHLAALSRGGARSATRT